MQVAELIPATFLAISRYPKLLTLDQMGTGAGELSLRQLLRSFGRLSGAARSASQEERTVGLGGRFCGILQVSLRANRRDG